MNMKTVLGLAAIIVIGGGAFVLLGGKVSAPGISDSMPTTSSGTSLQALVAAGSSVTCTYATTTPGGTVDGVVYIANGMIAGDFTNGTQAGTIQSHMIIRDNTTYLWTSLSSQGIKSTIQSNSSETQGQGVGYNTNVDYKCSSWTPDTTKFNLPSNISFTANAYTAPSGTGASATGATNSDSFKGTAAQCAQCNALSGAQKAQCLTALSC